MEYPRPSSHLGPIVTKKELTNTVLCHPVTGAVRLPLSCNCVLTFSPVQQEVHMYRKYIFPLSIRVGTFLGSFNLDGLMVKDLIKRPLTYLIPLRCHKRHTTKTRGPHKYCIKVDTWCPDSKQLTDSWWLVPKSGEYILLVCWSKYSVYENRVKCPLRFVSFPFVEGSHKSPSWSQV